MQTTIENRVYDLIEHLPVGANTASHLLANGWDGKVYFGVSKPVARQRKVFTSLFYRNAKTGEFTKVLA